jgi:alpha-glucosidase
MRRLVDAYGERLLIGELYLPIERLVTYYGITAPEVHLPFNFHLIQTPWQAPQIAALITAYEAALPDGAWPNWVLGNHDQHRLANRVGAAQARVAAMLLLTLRGTPTLYYGDELSMQDGHIPPELVQDPWEKNVPGLGLGRDPERTPMQWDSSPHGGFTSGTPWLPVATDGDIVNVAAQRDDPTSMLTFYRRLIGLRRVTPALSVGPYVPLSAEGDVLAYVRTHPAQHCLIVLNMGSRSQRFELPQPVRQGRIALSTYLDCTDETMHGTIDLRGDEGVIVQLDDQGSTDHPVRSPSRTA